MTKNSGDYLVKSTAFGGKVAAIAICHTQTCRKMREIHSLSPVATAALGRLLGGTAMMSQDLKHKNASMSITLRGDGELGGMVAACTPEGMVRGYVSNPLVQTCYREKGKLDIGKAVGKGTLTVVKNLGLKEPYVGQTEIVSGEIAEDLAAYFLYSEQIPTVMGLGVKINREGVTHAGGFMVRLLPDAGDEILEYIEKRAAGFPEVTWLMEEGFNPRQILDLFLGDPGIKYLEEKQVGYECTCSTERMTANLITLGAKELSEMAKDPEGITLECHFCNKKYSFTRDEVNELYRKSK